MIDTRARVESSLGPVISASISDDYVQGNGLIKCSGSCLVKGVVSPPIGTPIVFNYTKNGITRRIPRPLRVLSAFADPFRKTTSMQLGCKLTYLESLQDPINWEALDDPANEDLTEEDQDVIIVPIHAQSIAQKCLQELGLTATGLSLTNKFSVATFDFSSGYVQVLGDLLVSECYCGYLNESEVLEVFPLSEPGANGPLLTEQKIIDVGEIGVGQLPGDAVIVTYSSLKLKYPDETDVTEESDPFSGWTTSSSSSTTEVLFSYKRRDASNSSIEFKTYNSLSTTEEDTKYNVFTFFNLNDDTPEEQSVVTKRIVTTRVSRASELGSYYNDLLSIGIEPGNPLLRKRTTETFLYDSFGREIFRESVTYGDYQFIAGKLGISFVYPGSGGFTVVTLGSAPEVVPIEKIVTYSTYGSYYGGFGAWSNESGGPRLREFTKQVTYRYGNWTDSISGQQALSASREYINTAEEATDLISRVSTRAGWHLLDVSANTSVGVPSSQRSPLKADIIREEAADQGVSLESKSEIVLATGNPSAQLRIELSMPYAPDDWFFKASEDSYYAYKSDAEQKAKNFGITQNRMLLGNRSGMNIQTVPEAIPLKPFSPVFVSVAGTVALYRTNATSWTIDASGIVVSTDAMYWGVAGRV